MSQDEIPPLRIVTTSNSSNAPARFDTGETKKKVSVVADDQGSSTSSGSGSSSADEKSKSPSAIASWFETNFSWVKQNWTWSKLKPALRCAVVGWVSVVLFVIPAVQRQLGQASFLILIASFLSPPMDPFISVFERESLILVFACTAWAWSCLGIFLANLARDVHDPQATLFDAATGQYIEAGPTVILAVFIFFGSAFFLYIKARQGPGPYLFASVFGCICIDITLTTSVLLPYPFYGIGQAILLPLSFHSALALLASIFVFPSTISALFTTRLDEVLQPLLTTLSLHERLLATQLTSPSFGETLASLRTHTKASEAKLVPLAATGRLLKSDLIFSRFCPSDFTAFQAISRKLTARADGLGMYFGLIDPNRERFPGTGDRSVAVTPAPTAPQTPKAQWSRMPSRDPSPERGGESPNEHVKVSSPSISEPHDSSTSVSRNLDDSTSPSPFATLTPSNSNAVRQPVSNHAHTSPKAGLSASVTPHTPRHLHFSTFFHKASPSNASETPTPTPEKHRHGHYSHPHPHHHHHLHHDLLHQSLLSLSKSRSRRQENTVGMFETQRYLNLEFTRFHDPNEEYYTSTSLDLLRECCTPLLNASHLGLSEISTWLSTVRIGRLGYIRNMVVLSIFGPRLGRKAKHSQEQRRNSYDDRMRQLWKVKKEVERAQRVFREETRFLVLDPYKVLFEDHPENVEHDLPSPMFDEEQLRKKAPAHRYLFHCYVYQYHLLHLAGDIIEMLDEIIRLEKERPWPKCRFWIPVLKVFKWDTTLIAEQNDQDDLDDDPNLIQGLQHDTDQDSLDAQNKPRMSLYTSYSSHNDLGIAGRRDPDALPPRNAFEWVLNLLHAFVAGLGGGNATFAIKAGLLTVVLCLPSFIKHSAQFAYENRFVWAIFMGQLTIARFRGDTAFGLTARIVSTFGGGVVGMVMWYISTGLGRGNPYGLAAVCAVCFPFFFFARLYWPIPPMTNLIFFVTSMLVIGYSYQDAIMHLPGSPGSGYTVAWRRFVLVTAGVTAAFIVSLLPPSTTLRSYQRHLLSTTSSELGSIYCSILSYANTKHEGDKHEILASLIAVRNKLKRSTELRTNVGYEFSLRGRWPLDRYQKIAELQMAIAYSLSHLASVIKHLEPSWALAFLRRTRFLDPDFQGDLLAVISMISNSLRTGCPLPQITPCPLIDRFTLRYHGLNVIHKEAEEDYGLPRTLTLKTLQNEQYLIFCVGVATAYGIVNRLDRLMVAVKELVGEQYHIHGVGVPTRQLSNLLLTPSVSLNVAGFPSTREVQGLSDGDRSPA